MPLMTAGLRRFAWGVLAYNVVVILWGAYVRATGSGAGCGNHWPLCNGEVLPRAATTATAIEFSHRLTSGLALLAVLALLVWVWRTCPPGHLARRGAVWSLLFILAEAAIGAGLVLFELVADNATMARALFMAAHLVNTFVLLAFLTLTAHWLSHEAVSPGRVWGTPSAVHPAAAAALSIGAVLLLATGTSGAVAALGDTLYPATSLGNAVRADLSATSHFLIRLRVLHPAIAVATALLLMFGAPRLAARGLDKTRRLAWTVSVVAAVQLVAGLLNVVLLAPVWMQLVHLLLADVIWIVFVLLGATVLGSEAAGTPVRVTVPGPRRADRAAAEPGLHR
jgi:cytochrome c oxidase assembly protein subunit 15